MEKKFQYILKGDTFYLYFRKDANAESRRLYQEAIKLDSNFSRAYADLAYSQLHAWVLNWDDAVTMDQAFDNAQQAIGIDDKDYYHHWVLAAVHLYRKEFDPARATYDVARQMAVQQAVPEEERAVRADWADMLLLTGKPVDAIKVIDQVIAESPIPEKWFYWVQGWAYYVDSQFDASLAALSHIGTPRNAMRKNVICNLVALNRVGEARDQARQFLDEEKSQGIVYAAPGQDVFPALEKIENRLPFEDPAQLATWKTRLADGFQGVPQP